MKPNKLRDVLGGSMLAVGILTLAACGGSDSTTTNNNDPTTATVKLSGLVADGYLTGAKVCLDKSRNKRCDAGEPFAISTTGGAYELVDVPQSDAAAYPVIAEVVAGITYDEDNPTAPVGSPYTLTAPVGKHGFVSPITTMIQTRIDTTPSLTPAQAESAIKLDMGYPADSSVSLFTDYVAAAADSTNPDAGSYAHVHEVAKVTARVLEANQQSLENAALAAGRDLATEFDALINIIVQQVLLELGAIAADPVNYNTATVTAAVTTATTDINTAFDQQETQQSTSTVSNMETVMKSGGGLGWTWGWTDGTNYELDYGTAIVNAANEFTGNTDLRYSTLNPQWNPIPASTGYDIVMGAAGWFTSPESAPRMATFNNDGTWSLTHPSGISETSSVTEVDVSGKLIAGYVADNVWRSLMSATARFTTGAKIYNMVGSWDQDYYHVRFWNDPAGCGIGIPYVDATTNCNGLVVNNSFSAATTLDAAFSTSLTDTAWIWAWQVNTMNGQGAVKLIRANAADTSGVASYGYIDATNTYVQLVASTWSKVTVNGVDMILMDLPLAVRQQVNDIDSDTEKMMLTVHEGYLRWGEYTSTAFVNTFNMYSATALQDIVANVTLP